MEMEESYLEVLAQLTKIEKSGNSGLRQTDISPRTGLP
jgi:hypothetical protein